jgi:acyl carrier protein
MSETTEAVLRDVIAGVAPEADLGALDPKADLREALDIDSMDFLNVMIALHKRLGVEIPEADYPKLFTFDGAIAYLSARRAGG